MSPPIAVGVGAGIDERRRHGASAPSIPANAVFDGSDQVLDGSDAVLDGAGA